MIAVIKPFLPLLLKLGFAIVLSGGLIAWFQITRAENRALRAEVASYEQAYITNRKTIETLEEHAAKRDREIRQYVKEKNLYQQKVAHVNRKLSAILKRDAVRDWADGVMPDDADQWLQSIEDDHSVGNDHINPAGRTHYANRTTDEIWENERRLAQLRREFINKTARVQH